MVWNATNNNRIAGPNSHINGTCHGISRYNIIASQTKEAKLRALLYKKELSAATT